MAVELENHEFIYLLCEREFTRTEEDIYKIGRTNRKDMAMFADYTKGSLLLFYSFCNNFIILIWILSSVYCVYKLHKRANDNIEGKQKSCITFNQVEVIYKPLKHTMNEKEWIFIESTRKVK